MAKIVIALGGNALQKEKEADDAAQKHTAVQTVGQISRLIERGHQVVVVHGNGPQVGAIMLHETAGDSADAPAMPLDTCVAMSQGQIGYWLQQGLHTALRQKGIERQVVTIVTQTLVEADDPAFRDPSKPIGPFYDEATAKQIHTDKGYIMKQDAGRGWRRVVASPKPIDIIEKDFIQNALSLNAVVIAAGGGGIPVIAKHGTIEGVAAVVDKDFAAERIAALIDADVLLILTNVPAVTINYKTPHEAPIGTISVMNMQSYIDAGQFAPGSMLPKVEAAVAFVRAKAGRKAIITSPKEAFQAFEGGKGTCITAV